jgi:hypothetical protein
MKALSVRQPWAELIALGRKTIEVRSRTTHYRGRLLICSGLNRSKFGTPMHGPIGEVGVAVCLVELLDSRVLTVTDSALTGYEVTQDPAFPLKMQWAWVLGSPVRLPPIAIKGSLSFFEVPDDLVPLPRAL